MSGNENSAPVKIDIGAKAEASFRVQTEIPSSSTGRLLDALTDIIRPFSERRGLQADRIRLQREELAIEVASLAQNRIVSAQGMVKPVPSKILIPLLEKCSNEDPTDEYMKQRWADLLASASIKSSVHPRFVQIMSEMNGSDVERLEQIALNNHSDWQLPHRVFEDVISEVEESSPLIRDIYELRGEEFENIENFLEFCEDLLNRPGCILYIALCKAEGLYETGMPFTPETGMNLEILETLGLLRKIEMHPTLTFGIHEVSFLIIYYHLTQIGHALIKSCSPSILQTIAHADSINRHKHPENVNFKGYTGNFRVVYKTDFFNAFADRIIMDED